MPHPTTSPTSPTSPATRCLAQIEWADGDAAALANWDAYRQEHRPVVLVLDCEHRRAYLEVVWGEATPVRRWHHLEVAFRFCGVPTVEAANARLREVAPLLTQICDCFHVEWNGSNHVGRFDDGVEEIEQDIQSALDLGEGETVVSWDAAEWIGDTITVGAETDLDALEAELETQAESEGIHELRGLRDALEALQAEAEAHRIDD